MKKILYPVFFTLFALIASSCDNEPLEGEFGDLDGGNGGGSNGGSFVATIDGNSFVADGAIAMTLNSGDMVQTTISGTNLSGNSISIQILSSGTGTYELSNPVDFDNPGDGTGMYAQLSSQSFPFVTTMNSTGTVEITEYDTDNLVVSGTFSFEAEREVENEDGSTDVETVSITEGEFTNIQLQIQGDGNGGEGSGGEGEGEGSGEDAIFQVELDEELFEGEEIQAVNNEDGLQIGAKNGTILVSLQIFDPAIGDFDLGNEDEAIVYYTLDAEDEDAPLYISNSGTITISSIDFSTNTVSGSFVGTVSDVFGDQSEVVMTNGVFENISFESVAGVDSATALVDGEQFQANTFAEASVEGSSEVTLNFVSDLDDRITITIPQQPEVGVYPISETPPYSASFTAFVDDPTEVNYEAQADSGEIEIISFENGIVTGTFSFTGVADNGDTITITEGEFTYEF